MRSDWRALLVVFLPLLGVPAGAEERAPYSNQLDPDATSPGLAPDADDFNVFQPHLRSPFGLLYEHPAEPPEATAIGTSGWSYEAALEAGYLGTWGDDEAASFREYGDWDDGPLLLRFAGALNNPESAQYLKFDGGSPGRDDQYLRLGAGRYGDYALSLAYDSTPHVFTSTARVLWDGVGSDTLTLPAGLTPGASSLAEVAAAFEAIDESVLKLERDKLRFGLDYDASARTRWFANGSIEWRDGERPIGGSFSYPNGGQVAQIVEQIDYTTTTFDLGYRFSGASYQANLLYSGSLFQNDASTLTWDNPGLSPFPVYTPAQGRYALAPDNEYHRLRTDLAATLPFWRGRITASGAWNRSSQDEALLPPATGSGIVGMGVNAIDLDRWNTTAALSQDTADAEFETRDLHSKLTLNPTSRINLYAELRIEDQDNDTEYTAFNPLTGEFGYLVMDGAPDTQARSLSGIYHPGEPGSNVRFRSVPFEKDQRLGGAGLEYRVSRDLKFGLHLVHEENEPQHREVDELVENRYRAQLGYRVGDSGNLRFDYLYGDRDGDDYRFDPYEAFFTSSLPDYVEPLPEGNRPHTLSAMRKFDMSNRESHDLDLKYTVTVVDDLDVLLSGSLREYDYSADYGRDGKETVAANLELDYRLGENNRVYAYYSWQRDEGSFGNITSTNASSTDPAPGGPVYPLDRAWSAQVREDTHNLGAGFSATAGSVTLDVSYTYLDARSRSSYDYATPAAFLDLYDPALVGNRFPDQEFSSHRFECTLKWQVRKGTSLNLLYRYERERIDDFHYQGFEQPLIGYDVYLLAVPEDFSVHVVGVSVETAL